MYYIHKIADAATKGKGIKCHETITAFAKAVIYEPSNEYGKLYTYIYGKPEDLPYYLRQFDPGDQSCIINSKEKEPFVKQCVYIGVNGESPDFLGKEGHYKCSLCLQDLCRYCTHTYGDGVICTSCYRISFGNKESKIEDITVMREHLTSIGKEIPSSASFIQVLELYELEIEKTPKIYIWKTSLVSSIL